MAYKIVTTFQSQRDIDTMEQAEAIMDTILDNATGLWSNVIAVSIVDAEDGTPVVEKEQDGETNVFN